MAEDKNKKVEELQDEQLDEVAGGKSNIWANAGKIVEKLQSHGIPVVGPKR